MPSRLPAAGGPDRRGRGRHPRARRDPQGSQAAQHPGRSGRPARSSSPTSASPRASRASRPAPRPARLIEGSLPYMSPEQTGRMNRAIDSRSDLYSLGVTFYQLLTGRLPFEADDADRVGALPRRAQAASPLDALRPAVPAALSDIVMKLLAKVPDDRYQSARGPAARSASAACAQWRETGRIEPFPLGERDVSRSLPDPAEALRPRAPSRASCTRRSSACVATGRPELVLVSGYSGIGKSSLVHELHRPIVRARGLFVAGKFDQYKRDIPYFTIVQAFRELVLDILAESEAQHRRLAASARRRRSGPTAQLIVDLIPQVELVIGPQPPVPGAAAGEAQNRLAPGASAQFLGVFATAGASAGAVPRRPAVGRPGQPEAARATWSTHPSTRHLLAGRRLPRQRGRPVAPADARAGRDPRAAGARDHDDRAGAAAPRRPRASSSPTRSTARAARGGAARRAWSTRRPAAIPSSPSSS